MLNFYNTNINLYSFILLWFMTSLVFYTKNTYVSWVDFYSRTCVGDFFLNLYYYFWTSFWYIPTVLFIIWLFGLYRTVWISPNMLTLLFIASYVFIFLLHDYWSFNSISYNPELSSVNLNLLLVNSINKYHPLIFYYAFMCTFIGYSLISLTTLVPREVIFQNPGISYTNLLDPTNQVVCVISALYLGSWWALQEGSWGGWWNWDPSEVFGLVVMIVLLSSTHLYQSLNRSYILSVGLLVSALVIQWLYIFIQLNFNLISHNFGIKVPGPVNTSQFFMLICTVTVVVCIWSLLSLSVSLVNYLYTKGTVSNSVVGGKNVFQYWLLYLLLTLPALLSFSPLVSDFVLKLFELSLLNYLPSAENYVLLVLLTGLLVFCRLDSRLVMLLVWSLCAGSYWCLPILLGVGSFLHLRSLHLLLLLVLVTSATHGYTSTVIGLFPDSSTALCGAVGELVYSTSLGNFLHTVTDLGYTWFGGSTPSLVSTPYSFFSQNTSLEVSMFTLVGQGNMGIQNLNLNIFGDLFTVCVTDPSTNALLIITASVLLELVLFSYRKLIIIF